jgi:hypothetical protein
MITASTTLDAFVTSIRTRLATQLSFAQNRVFLVDKLRMSDSAVPNLQIELMSLTAVADNTGLNVSTIEYKVHAVVKVEKDFGKSSTQRLSDTKSAFLVARNAANALRLWKPDTGSSNQVWTRLDSGSHDDAAGLASASASFRSFIRLMDDG